MCWVLYLAADRALSLRTFDPGAPAFNVAELTGRETAVRVQFSKPFVYAVGAHTSCGCGFDRGQAHPDRPAELEATEVSLQALRSYLDKALEVTGSIEALCVLGRRPSSSPRSPMATQGDGLQPPHGVVPGSDVH
jgi:hypothetical protein